MCMAEGNLKWDGLAGKFPTPLDVQLRRSDASGRRSRQFGWPVVQDVDGTVRLWFTPGHMHEEFLNKLDNVWEETYVPEVCAMNKKVSDELRGAHSDCMFIKSPPYLQSGVFLGAIYVHQTFVNNTDRFLSIRNSQMIPGVANCWPAKRWGPRPVSQ